MTMKRGDIVRVCAGALRGAIGTVEEVDEWGYQVRLWGDERPGPRYFDYADVETLQPATAFSELHTDLARVNRAIQSYDITRVHGRAPMPSFPIAKKQLEEERQTLLEMLTELGEATGEPVR